VPRLRFSGVATESIAQLAPRLQDAVLNTILLIQADPWVGGRRLRGRMEGMWVARVGSYRVLYTIEGPQSAATVVIQRVLHRSIASRTRRRRT
jgi:mRNA-degrading endonuclease RelE of RelBE toxin-antitoxin system